MPAPLSALSELLQRGFDAVEKGADPVLRPSTRPGVDFQANGALALAKRLGRPPREIAEEAVAAAGLEAVCSSVEVAPQGFVNLTLAASFLTAEVRRVGADPRLGVGGEAGRRVVVDYSAPNVAKEMHVGHLRSTIIGDALCRLLAFTGDAVIRENHIGDWGTPFGMLIEHLVESGPEGLEELSVGELGNFYVEARASFDSDPAFAERARRRVVALQSGDATTLELWRSLVERSAQYFSEVYALLGVLLTPDDVVGESHYNPELPGLVADLDAAGLIVGSDGARCVFPRGFTNREREPLPLIVQKSDGGFGYAATDLAALRDRFVRLGAELVLYVVGAPQALHLRMCFEVAREMGWMPSLDAAVHVSFGNVLGTDGRMLSSRSGGAVSLRALLVEAVQRADAAVAERNPELSAEERQAVARAVGIGAVKYSDLSTDRTRDYVFDWDRMLAFEGNTGPYLQYAHARVSSIFRRGGLSAASYETSVAAVLVDEPAERALALSLLGFAGAVSATMATWSPHKLCAYLFDLAGEFTSFYEACPVLGAPEGAVREGRLTLCALTARVLRQGLGLLGIDAPERM